MTHPAHFTRRVPTREAPGLPTAEEVFPDDGDPAACRAKGGHWWHRLGLRWLDGARCCQCGAQRRWWQR